RRRRGQGGGELGDGRGAGRREGPRRGAPGRAGLARAADWARERRHALPPSWETRLWGAGESWRRSSHRRRSARRDSGRGPYRRGWVGIRRARRPRYRSRAVQERRDQTHGVLRGAGDEGLEGESGSQVGPAGARGETSVLAVAPGPLRLRLVPIIERRLRQAELLFCSFFHPTGFVTRALGQRLTPHSFCQP